MASFIARALVDFPQGQGSNVTDVLINGVHFNRTALDFFNYTLWSNNTLSNASDCYLVFDQYQPSMLDNGTFINGTSCYDPYYGIAERGILSIVFSCLYLASVLFTSINLRKHGRLFLPSEKRFRAIGRRWQWYWMFFVAACGAISGFTGIDVDRDYLQGISLILQSFFYYLMTPSIMAVVWESVRHWGSWQERQMVDRDSFSLPQTGARDRAEFYMPLVFYLFGFLNFFMVIPRNWGGIDSQGSALQIDTEARPTATDLRFKVGAFFIFAAWCLICYNLRHSIHYYKPRNRGPINSLAGFVRYVPGKFLLVIPLAGVVVGYSIATSFLFDISPLKYNVGSGWMWGLGQAPIILILFVLEIWGYVDENEDKVLLRQRRDYGRAVDAELGLGRKPGWWSQRRGDIQLTDEERLKALASEVGGGPATRKNIEQTLELGNMPVRPRGEDPFSDDATTTIAPSETGDDSPERMERMQSTRDSTYSVTAQTQPTKIKSMLDV